MNAFVNRILPISEKKMLSEYDLPLPVQKKIRTKNRKAHVSAAFRFFQMNL